MENMQKQSCEDDTHHLKKIRQEIDAVDSQLLELFNKRAALSKKVGNFKHKDNTAVFKPVREHELLDKLVKKNKGPLPESHLRAIWREILSSSRELQRPQNVAYLGPEGTFSYFAGIEYLGQAAHFSPCKDIPQIFEAVTSGACDLGVVPLENSLQGTVGTSFDLFSRYMVAIEAELYSRISHSLLSHAQSLADIEKVYSHPQALAQCGTWIRTHLPNAAIIPVESTAAAAARAADDPKAAAVCNIKLASKYNLEILGRAIEDEQGNWTRFVIIAPNKEKEGVAPARERHEAVDKASLLFTLPDKPGSLAAVLDLLARHGVNMRKLESRPMRGQPWRYIFFCDVEGNINQKDHGILLKDLAEACTTFRILGCYPSGPQVDRTPRMDGKKEDI